MSLWGAMLHLFEGGRNIGVGFVGGDKAVAMVDADMVLGVGGC